MNAEAIPKTPSRNPWETTPPPIVTTDDLRFSFQCKLITFIPL